VGEWTYGHSNGGGSAFAASAQRPPGNPLDVDVGRGSPSNSRHQIQYQPRLKQNFFRTSVAGETGSGPTYVGIAVHDDRLGRFINGGRILERPGALSIIRRTTIDPALAAAIVLAIAGLNGANGGAAADWPSD